MPNATIFGSGAEAAAVRQFLNELAGDERRRSVSELQTKARDAGVAQHIELVTGDDAPELPWELSVIFEEPGEPGEGKPSLKQTLEELEAGRLERTTIGDQIILRTRIPSSSIATKKSLEDTLSKLKRFKPKVEYLHYFGAAPPALVTHNDHEIRYLPGAISFKPGAISYKPGAISYKNGDLEFKPGAISYKERIIVPMPAECSSEMLNQILCERWRAGMEITESKQVTVAILDTGIHEESLKKHPLFVGSTIVDEVGSSPDLEVVPREGVVNAYFGHGTLVAGIIAQEAPLAKLNHESIRNRTGIADSFELARDLQDVAEADIVVLSLATSHPDATHVPVLRQVVRHLLVTGKIVVVADGTMGDLADVGHRLYPADFTITDLQLGEGEFEGRLISVRACDSNGEPMPGSRALHGNGRTVVTDYGVGVLSAFPHGEFRFGTTGPTLPFSGWARVTGTSFAAPRTAGRIAQKMIAGMTKNDAIAAALADLPHRDKATTDAS